MQKLVLLILFVLVGKRFHHGTKFTNNIVIGKMGISRDSRHKRSATGAKRAQFRKKRKFELGRQPANTKIGPKEFTLSEPEVVTKNSEL